MRKVKFLRATDPVREGGDFAEGQIVSVSEGAFRHWRDRGAVEEYAEPKKEEKKDVDAVVSTETVAVDDRLDSGKRPVPDGRGRRGSQGPSGNSGQ